MVDVLKVVGMVLVDGNAFDPICVHADVTDVTYGLTTGGATVDDFDMVPAWGTTLYY